MSNFSTCMLKATNAVTQLNRANENPANEMALLVAYSELESALFYCRRSFRERGFQPVDALQSRIDAGEFGEVG